MRLLRSHPMLLPKVIRPPNFMRWSIAGIQRQVLPSRKFEVLLAENATRHVVLIRLKLPTRQPIQISLRRLLVALDGDGIVIVNRLRRRHLESRQYHALVVDGSQVKRVSRKARRPRAVPRRHDGHGTAPTPVLGIPEESHALRGHVDEFGGPSGVQGSFRDARAGRFSVELGNVRLDVGVEFLRSVSEIEIHGLEGRVVGEFFVGEGALGGGLGLRCGGVEAGVHDGEEGEEECVGEQEAFPPLLGLYAAASWWVVACHCRHGCD
mmetsp:Transcript_5919/g.11495  ORF Transcript_5919/g.11495 Transcript_5919/m.11495 type:complete len:266 (-) Transcript_5919:3-800(-)